MKDSLMKSLSYIKEYWLKKSKKQKILLAVSFLIALIFISSITYIFTRTEMVPLYTNLKPSETGSIKENLDSKGIKSEIAHEGTMIKVPKENVESLMVELAAEGIPNTGNIGYSFFKEKSGFGMTNNEFNVLKLDATQNELAELITTVNGIEQAQVMINLPDQGIFVSDFQEEASASIILQTKPGYDFSEKQIKSLYHLVSKSVPNLPLENIVIRNQFLEYFDLNDTQQADSGYEQQMKIKEQVEKNIQRQVERMLATLMGNDKVVTSVTTDIDFTQENREEDLVVPVDEENMRGIAISAQRITEMFSGDEEQAGGIPQGADPADAGATQYFEGAGGSGEYEKNEETINYEVNKIRKEIVESPYKIRDLGIQVMVEPPDLEEVNSFPQERVEDIKEILSTIVRTSINKDADTDLSEEAIDEKIHVSVQPFNGKHQAEVPKEFAIPWWIYIVASLIIAIVALLIYRRNKARDTVAEEAVQQEYDPALDQIASAKEVIPEMDHNLEKNASNQLYQLEELAKENPERFARLLRKWLVEDREV